MNLIDVRISFKTLNQLGLNNCILVAVYRILVKIRFYKIINKVFQCPVPKIIIQTENLKKNENYCWGKSAVDICLKKGDQIINGYLFYFGHQSKFVGNPPNWFYDYKNNFHFNNYKYHWSECRHFLKGDIKECWEISRWNWALSLARAYKISSNTKYINYLNKLISDWCVKNPVNSGINWLCGQEVSLRLINFLLTMKIIFSEEKEFNKKLLDSQRDFIFIHLERINQTMFYARAQNNNHWISESAALFIGGSLLMQSQDKYFNKAKKWAFKGRKSLEKSIKQLVMSDGSFTQHSLTYHRFVLDLLCQVEIWRNSLELSEFSSQYQKKFSLLLNWMSFFVDKDSGDAPNLGANDGAYCFQLHDLHYRDFRPTLQLSSFLDKKSNYLMFPPGPWDEGTRFLRLSSKKYRKNINRSNKVFIEGGYIVMQSNNSNTWGLLRLPKYKIRPSHNDPLHFDLWSDGINILRDGGSFSYSASSDLLNFFTGINSHNSIEFKESQMIRYSRFLLGSKIRFYNKIKKINNYNYSKYGAEYNFKNNFHSREIIYREMDNSWEIIDNFSSCKNGIILRWRLNPSDWQKNCDYVFESKETKLSILTENNIKSCNLTETMESRNYGEITKIPVIEVNISGYEGKIKTLINIV